MSWKRWWRSGTAHWSGWPISAPCRAPCAATTIGFLDDLFVDPAARGAKVGERLLERLNEISVERGWNKIRWITADDNYRARTLYDRLAVKTAWNMYEMTP